MVGIYTAALGLILISGCHAGSGLAPQRDSIGATVSTKEVVAKRAPETLIASDGTTCGVSPDRFATAGVGQMVRCPWRPG